MLPTKLLRLAEAVAFSIRYGDREVSCFAVPELLKANGIADLAKLASGDQDFPADNKSVLAGEQLLLHELDDAVAIFISLT